MTIIRNFITGMPGDVEIDLEADTFTRRLDGEIVEERSLTPEERNIAELPDAPDKVRTLMSAVDQLILNDLLDL